MSTCSEGHGCVVCSINRAFKPLVELGRRLATVRDNGIDEGYAPSNIGPGTDVSVRSSPPTSL